MKLNTGNSPLGLTLGAEAEGFWRQDVPVLVDLDGPERVDFHLLRQCTATVLGGTVVDDTGAAVAGSRVTLGGEETITDEGGNFLFDVEVLLGFNNARTFYVVGAEPPSSFPAGTDPNFLTFEVAACGQIIDGLELILFPPPAEHFGTVIGTVTAADTGLPVADAPVTLRSEFGAIVASTDTDADGNYRIEDVFLGEGDTTSRSYFVFAGRLPNLSFDYWWGTSDVFVLHSGETASIDIALIPTVRASVAGVVTDRDTGEPLAGASVSASGSSGSGQAFADSGGGYRIDDLLTAFPNAEFTSSVIARKSGYWTSIDEALLRPAEVTTLNVSLLEICQGGTIRGTVFNAETLEPLEAASVFSDPGASGPGIAGLTDATGHFELIGVAVDFENAPRLATVTARKTGFITAACSVSTSDSRPERSRRSSAR
jgi:hypothetical protein